MESVEREYARWLANVEPSEAEQLKELEVDSEAVRDAFYCELAFGTAGLRGVIGMGPNRMNVYTVGKATQGFADYLVANFDEPRVAIARDSRNMGEVFVKAAASVLAANGIEVHVFPRIAPTPVLSFAVRDLHCSGGINITASHNPAEYNGYKAYGPDGCQITSQASKDIQAAIDRIDCFACVKSVDFDEAVETGLVKWIGEGTIDNYLAAVQALSLEDESLQRNPLKLVYTPLNGTGLECVKRILDRVGVNDVTVVEEQAVPDGDFPTCPYPNPEDRAALELGLKLCDEVKPDLLLATDPDADRVGIAVPHDGSYVLLTGNEVGVLMLDYICTMRKQRGEDLSSKVAVSTIVSSAMPDALAREYGFQMRRVLTGFKYIGDQIAQLEDHNQVDRFIFGFEESYGYMSGSHVRDKDAVNASMIICQMTRWHKAQGHDLAEAMESLYKRIGYYLNKTISITYPGAAGSRKMKELTSAMRSEPPAELAGRRVTAVTDFATGAPLPYVNQLSDPDQTLPAADVLEFLLEDGCKILVRPSGTEPKIKAYLFSKASDRPNAERVIGELEQVARRLLA